GRKLVVAGQSVSPNSDNVQRLFIRSLGGTTDLRPIPDTDGAYYFTFDPESEWVAFKTSGWLKKHSLITHETIPLCECSTIMGLDWGADGTIVFAGRAIHGLYLVSASGGTPHEVTIQDSLDEDVTIRHPQFLPNGKDVLVTLFNSNPEKRTAGVISLETGRLTALPLDGGNFFRYIPAIGHIAFKRGNHLVTRSFDPRRLKLGDREVSTGHYVGTGEYRGGELDGEGGGSQFSVSNGGKLVFKPFAEREPRLIDLIEVGLNGNVTRLEAKKQEYGSPSLSPDGSKIAVPVRWDVEDGIWDLYVMAVDGSNSVKVSTNVYSAAPPVWHPDGDRIAFSSDRSGNHDVFLRAIDGSGVDSVLVGTDSNEIPWSWTSDGHALAYIVGHDGPQRQDIFLLYDTGETTVVISTPTDVFKAAPEFSPDDRYLVYTAGVNQMARQHGIYVRPVPESGATDLWIVHEGFFVNNEIGGDLVCQPQWAPEGNAIYFRGRVGGQRYLMQVEIELEPTFRKIGDPEVVFEFPQGARSDAIWHRFFDIHPVDGNRFLMTQDNDQKPQASSINIIINWFDEIARLHTPN
ncbi:hypothetical protein ACFL3H_10150, partial [Gemmatimonadota bacterium]